MAGRLAVLPGRPPATRTARCDVSPKGDPAGQSRVRPRRPDRSPSPERPGQPAGGRLPQRAGQPARRADLPDSRPRPTRCGSTAGPGWSATPTSSIAWSSRATGPILALVVEVEEVFHHCAKAFLRSAAVAAGDLAADAAPVPAGDRQDAGGANEEPGRARPPTTGRRTPRSCTAELRARVRMSRRAALVIRRDQEVGRAVLVEPRHRVVGRERPSGRPRDRIPASCVQAYSAYAVRGSTASSAKFRYWRPFDQGSSAGVSRRASAYAPHPSPGCMATPPAKSANSPSRCDSTPHLVRPGQRPPSCRSSAVSSDVARRAPPRRKASTAASGSPPSTAESDRRAGPPGPCAAAPGRPAPGERVQLRLQGAQPREIRSRLLVGTEHGAVDHDEQRPRMNAGSSGSGGSFKIRKEVVISSGREGAQSAHRRNTCSASCRVPDQHAGVRRARSGKLELQRGDHAEAAATAPQRPEQVRVLARVGAHWLPSAEHQLDCGQAVGGHAELAGVPADAAAQL